MQSPIAMIGAAVLATIFAVVGVLYIANVFPGHHLKHALLFFGLAVVAAVVASFLRPRTAS